MGSKKKEAVVINLTRDMILETRDELEVAPVELKGKNGKVRGIIYVREMSGTEKDIWERSMMKRVASPNPKESTTYETTLEDYKGKLAVVTLCDESGNLLFDMRDVKKLSRQLSATNLERIVNKAQEINAISEKDKEEILGNSEADQKDNSTLGSAEN